MANAFLLSSLGILGLLSILVSPRVRSTGGFFAGRSETGKPPGLWMLVLSQVTTWIFARSLLNAALLGYAFGIVGTIAYAMYYASFLTGGWIVDAIRFRHGHTSIQTFLRDRFGAAGTLCFNIVIILRLLSEVFANLLVVGLIFGAAGSAPYVSAICAAALVILIYAMMGGLRSSLLTDVLQMVVFLVLMVVLIVALTTRPAFDITALLTSTTDPMSPGWVLLIVAALQVWSYPMHDPVMMDRGFLVDRDTTRRSFYHAFWLSTLCIVGFGLLGVYAGLHKLPGEDMNASLLRLFGDVIIAVLNLSIIISAASTVDSALTSASKLIVVDMRLAPVNARNGRIAMFAFTIGGMILLFTGSKDLFDAVAISGTASLYLAPVVFFSVWGGASIPIWSYLTSFVTAFAGSILYLLESGKYVDVIAPLTGYSHSYSKLLVITLAVLAAGCGAFALGFVTQRRTAAP